MEATLGSSAMADLGERILVGISKSTGGARRRQQRSSMATASKGLEYCEFPSPNLLIKLTYPRTPLEIRTVMGDNCLVVACFPMSPPREIELKLVPARDSAASDR